MDTLSKMPGPMTRIKQLIERNRNPRVTSQDEFDAWLLGSKVSLLKRRAAEVLKHMRINRLIAADRGGNTGLAVAAMQPEFQRYMRQAREEIDLYRFGPKMARAA